jgi:hypothetical protein
MLLKEKMTDLNERKEKKIAASRETMWSEATMSTLESREVNKSINI